MCIFYIMFGCIMCITLFPIDVVDRNFMLLKVTFGRGVFNIFVALMLLYTESTYNYVMAALFAAIGGCFIFLSIMSTKVDDIESGGLGFK